MPSGSGDRWPEDYERGRPGWPAEVLGVVNLPRTSTVLDLGAGTGKLTRLLVPAFDRVIAVEPAEPMRRLLACLCPEAEPRAGTAQEIPLPGSSVDAVFVAQAFHKFDDERAVAELTRVLRPGGPLVLLWNLPAGPWEPSPAEAEELLDARMPAGDRGYIPLDLGGPHASSGWSPAVAASPFEPFQTTVLANPQALDPDGLVSFYASMDWIADLPDADRLPLLAEVRSRLTAAEYVRVWDAHVHWTHASMSS